MQFAGNKANFEMSIANFEEPLLKNNPQGLVAQKSGGLLLAQSGLEPIAVTEGLELAFLGDSRKLEQIERAVHGVHCKKTRPRVSAFHSKQKIRHIDVRNAPQGPAADSPIETREPCR